MNMEPEQIECYDIGIVAEAVALRNAKQIRANPEVQKLAIAILIGAIEYNRNYGEPKPEIDNELEAIENELFGISYTKLEVIPPEAKSLKYGSFDGLLASCECFEAYHTEFKQPNNRFYIDWQSLPQRLELGPIEIRFFGRKASPWGVTMVSAKKVETRKGEYVLIKVIQAEQPGYILQPISVHTLAPVKTGALPF